MREFGTIISGNRGCNHELSNEQRAGILSALEAGESKSKIAQRFRCSRQTIYNTISRWDKHESIQSLPRSGTPKKLTPRQERQLLRIVRANPSIKYAQLKAQVAGINVKYHTIWRLMKKHYIRKWIAKKRLKLKLEHARLRLEWAYRYRHY